MPSRAGANCRAVAPLAFRCWPIHFDELSVIDIAAKRALNSFEVWPMSVTGQLHARSEARRQIVHERHSGFAVTGADVPRHNELAIGVQPNPRPNVASAFRGSFRGRNVLLLGI